MLSFFLRFSSIRRLRNIIFRAHRAFEHDDEKEIVEMKN